MFNSPSFRRDRPVKVMLVGGFVVSVFLAGFLWLALPVFLPIDELAISLVDDTRSAMHPRSYLLWHLEKVRTVSPFVRNKDGDSLAQHLLTRYRTDAEAREQNQRMFDTLQILARRGMSFDVASARSGTNALHDAVLAGYADVVEFLLANGANPNFPVQKSAGPPLEGQRPLALVSRLLERGLASDDAQRIAQTLRAAGAKP